MGPFRYKAVWDQSIMVRQPRHWTASSRSSIREEAKKLLSRNLLSSPYSAAPSFVTRKIGIKPRALRSLALSSGFLEWKDWWRRDALHWPLNEIRRIIWIMRKKQRPHFWGTHMGRKVGRGSGTAEPCEKVVCVLRVRLEHIFWNI